MDIDIRFTECHDVLVQVYHGREDMGTIKLYPKNIKGNHDLNKTNHYKMHPVSIQSGTNIFIL
jgi:hypothetical protein